MSSIDRWHESAIGDPFQRELDHLVDELHRYIDHLREMARDLDDEPGPASWLVDLHRDIVDGYYD